MTAPHAPHEPLASPFRQPRAVWAVAFACVISFMGIGLVDPILPALAHDLRATPSQVSLLFTSYLIVTAVAMLVVGPISSRIGAKRTLVLGLTIIVVFSALAGTSGTINGIVGFRAGWGLGNALFIATSLAVIVSSATGGFAGAIILYEAALGLGIAVGPLLGGELGSISWRGPFFGVAVLMGIALVATMLFVPSQPKPARPTPFSAPLRALRHRGLLTMGLAALLYNWGFFTMLGYAPYPMELNAHRLGLVFFGWGLLVAIFSVFVAPRMQGRFGTAPVLYANLAALSVVLAVIAVGVDTPSVVITAVVVSGAFIGINNTLTTQAVMLVSPVERPVASSAYGFVRFIGGGLAPYAAGKLADHYDLSVPFFVGAGAIALAILVLATGHQLLAAAESGQSAGEPITSTEEPLEPTLVRLDATPGRHRPVVIAIAATEDARDLVAAAAEFARATGSPIELVHVHETTIVEEFAIDAADWGWERQALRRHIDWLTQHGSTASGLLLHSVGDHAAAGRVLARHANNVDARTVAIGNSPHGAAVQFAEGSLTHALIASARCPVVHLRPGTTARELTADDFGESIRP